MYSTETDGFAFLNLQRAMTGYDGPTIMMIRPTNASSIYSTSSSSSPSSTPSPGLFGVYTTNPWKESNTFHGTSDCFLFRADLSRFPFIVFNPKIHPCVSYWCKFKPKLLIIISLGFSHQSISLWASHRFSYCIRPPPGGGGPCGIIGGP